MTQPATELSRRELAILKANARQREAIEASKFGTPSATALARRRRQKARPTL